MRAEDNDATLSCVHCGKLIRADTYDIAFQRYNDHVKSDHGNPRHVRELGRNE